MEFIMRPIGIIHSPFQEKEQTPIQPSRSQAKGRVEVYPEFAAGLEDIEGFSHIILLYVFHQSAGFALRVTPFLDDQQHGLFATRYPKRPNPIGISVVRLARRGGDIPQIEGGDVVGGTTRVDIQPHGSGFDLRPATRSGWLERRGE